MHVGTIFQENRFSRVNFFLIVLTVTDYFSNFFNSEIYEHKLTSSKYLAILN